MSNDLIIFGVYIHPLIITAMIALILGEGISWALEKLNAYQFIWNPGLFDISIALILWGILTLPFSSL